MIDHEEIRRKRIFFFGLNVFWQEISDNLPKSLERLALGDETIFYAVKRAYMRFVPHIIESEQMRIAMEVDKLNTVTLSPDTSIQEELVSKTQVLSIIKSNK